MKQVARNHVFTKVARFERVVKSAASHAEFGEKRELAEETGDHSKQQNRSAENATQESIDSVHL